MDKKILAIDIGGSKIIVGLTDYEGNVLKCDIIELPESYDADFLIDNICSMSKKYLSEKPSAAGVTVPGLADSRTGTWLYAPFSGISDFNIAEILASRLGLKVFADNDVNACASAEKKFGLGKNLENFLWITVSNGVGGAICLDGKIFSGEHGSAGEIGHFTVEENTEIMCPCGKKGCLEAMASGKAISREYKSLTGQSLSAKTIALRAKNGDTDAKNIYYSAGFYLGKAIAYSINLLNISKVIIGGGVFQNPELLKKGIETAIDRYVFRYANKNISVEPTSLGYYAAMAGCCAIAVENMNKTQE